MRREISSKEKNAIKIKGSIGRVKEKTKNNKKGNKQVQNEGFAELLEYSRRKTLIR